jgi:putative membrane protein
MAVIRKPIQMTIPGLLLGVCLLYWNFPVKNSWRSLSIWSLVYLFGMSVEIVGLNTGLLFGTYQYGDNFGLKFYNVPVLIGINWVVLTFLTASICNRIVQHKWLAPLCGALLMAALDFFIEPVAPHFDFWSWEAGFAPLRNFVDRFVVSFFMQLIVRSDLPDGKNPFPMHHFASQVLFFAVFYARYSF